MKKENITKSDHKNEELEDILADRLARIFIEQIRRDLRREKNGEN